MLAEKIQLNEQHQQQQQQQQEQAMWHPCCKLVGCVELREKLRKGKGGGWIWSGISKFDKDLERKTTWGARDY